MKKVRLDQLLLDLKMAPSLEKARGLIGAGQVLVDDEPADKAGMSYPANSAVRLRKKCPYVSRGGFKLEQALSYFNVNLDNLVCADIGASTGGFTDCLLQHGAPKVYAVDVAYGQLAWKIRQDGRVVVMERTNARTLTIDDFKEPINLAVMDASFISITKLILPLLTLFEDNINIIALIKPQFELPKSLVGDGVVRDNNLHNEAIEKIQLFLAENNLKSLGVTPSPILGPKGNKEFLIYITNE